MADNNQQQAQSNTPDQDKNKPVPTVAQPPQSPAQPAKPEPVGMPEKKA